MTKKRIRKDTLVAVEGIAYASLALVPVVGGTITALMGVYGSELIQRRIDTLAAELDTTMKQVETKVDREFLKTDEWADLVVRVVRDSLQTSDRKKVRYLAAVLAGSATTDRIDHSEVEAILNALAQLTDTDMQLARAIVEQMRLGVEILGDGLPDGVVPNAYFHASRLESAGFIERSGPWSPLSTRPVGRHQRPPTVDGNDRSDAFQLGAPDSLPMLAVATVLRARPDLKSARTCRVGVAAARTKAAVVMDSQLDLAQRAFRLDNRGDRALSLGSSAAHSRRTRSGWSL